MITITIPENTNAKAVKLASIDENLFDRVEAILFFAVGSIVNAITDIIANAPPPAEPVEGEEPVPIPALLTSTQSKLLSVSRRAIDDDSYRRSLARKLVLAGLTQGVLPATTEMLEVDEENGRVRYMQELITDDNLKTLIEAVVNNDSLIDQIL